jgi:hypothetical protein
METAALCDQRIRDPDGLPLRPGRNAVLLVALLTLSQGAADPCPSSQPLQLVV